MVKSEAPWAPTWTVFLPSIAALYIYIYVRALGWRDFNTHHIKSIDFCAHFVFQCPDVGLRSHLGSSWSRCSWPCLGSPPFATPYQRMSHKILAVSLDEVLENPFAPPCSQKNMDAELMRIESAEKLAATWGAVCGCSAIIVGKVACVVNQGTQRCQFYPEMERILVAFPRATPATAWLMLETENNADAVLFSKLATAVEHFHPYVLNEEYGAMFAEPLLALVRDKMQEYRLEEFRRNASAFDAFQARVGRIDG